MICRAYMIATTTVTPPRARLRFGARDSDSAAIAIPIAMSRPPTLLADESPVPALSFEKRKLIGT